MTLDVYAYAGEATPTTVIAATNPRPGASSGVFVSQIAFLTLAALVQVSQIQFQSQATPASVSPGVQIQRSSGGGLTPPPRKKHNRKRDETTLFLTGLL